MKKQSPWALHQLTGAPNLPGLLSFNTMPTYGKAAKVEDGSKGSSLHLIFRLFSSSASTAFPARVSNCRHVYGGHFSQPWSRPFFSHADNCFFYSSALYCVCHYYDWGLPQLPRTNPLPRETICLPQVSLKLSVTCVLHSLLTRDELVSFAALI